jgi:hypothetical protein
MCYFEIISPHGCSIFGIAAISVVPPAAHSYTSAYSGSGSDSDRSSPAPQKTPTGQVTTQLTTPEPVVTAPVPTESPALSGRRSHLPSMEPAGIPGYDDVITILIKSKDDPAAAIKNGLAFVVSNIVAIILVVALSGAAAVAVIWYGNRKRYWL